jgi:metal-responsive CopG/Arc/MetJ family transcriptional regulator
MGRATKIVGFSVPPAVAQEVEQIAHEEHRTKSELFREMLRVYQRFRHHRDRGEDRWVQALIAEAQAEQAQHPMSVEDLRREDAELTHYGVHQANTHRIPARAVPRLIAASRKRHQSPGGA